MWTPKQKRDNVITLDRIAKRIVKRTNLMPHTQEIGHIDGKLHSRIYLDLFYISKYIEDIIYFRREYQLRSRIYELDIHEVKFIGEVPGKQLTINME